MIDLSCAQLAGRVHPALSRTIEFLLSLSALATDGLVQDLRQVGLYDLIPAPGIKVDYAFISRVAKAEGARIHLILAKDDPFFSAFGKAPSLSAGIRLVKLETDGIINPRLTFKS